MTKPYALGLFSLIFSFSFIALAWAMAWQAQPNHPLSEGRDYGPRNIGGGASSFHGGEDIYSGGAYRDQPFYASHGGTLSTGTMRGYGNVLTVTNGGVRTLYGHANGFLVQNGTQVQAGQNIGLVGNTGNTVGATGVHLHYEIQVQSASGSWTAVDPSVARSLINSGMTPGTAEFAQAAIDGTIAIHGQTKAGVGFTGESVALSGEGTVAGPTGQQCDPIMMSIADQLSSLYRDMANQTLSDIITQPTSVVQMSCLDQLSAKYASEIGSKFMNDIGLGGGSNFPDFVQDTFLGIVADNFMGGALSGIQEAVNTSISNTISSVANAILPGLGGALGNIFGGGTDFDCKLMKGIWDLLQCVELPDFPKLFDLDFGGSFLSRPDSCVGQALYDGALDMLNNSGLANNMTEWSAEASQDLNQSIRCSVASGTDCQ